MFYRMNQTLKKNISFLKDNYPTKYILKKIFQYHKFRNTIKFLFTFRIIEIVFAKFFLYYFLHFGYFLKNLLLCLYISLNSFF